MKLGETQDLYINRIVSIGAYLSENINETDKTKSVLLPKKQLDKNLKINDKVNVFLYRDSQARLIATVKKPYITIGQIAELKCVDKNNIGAFLDMGLERDLFLPFSEQKKEIKVGDRVKVMMRIDKSERLCATMFIDNNEKLTKVKNSDLRTFEYNKNAEKVYNIIKKEFKGHLVYNDKNIESKTVEENFNMSKNKFKDAIGKLLKEDKIKINDKGIWIY